MEDKMHKVRIKIEGCRAVCPAMTGKFTNDDREPTDKTEQCRYSSHDQYDCIVCGIEDEYRKQNNGQA